MAEETVYLELSEENDGAHKFYEVVTRDTQVHIRYGRIGDQGQTQSHAHATEELAKKFAQKKIREKMQKGYAHAVMGQRQKRAVTRRQIVSQAADELASFWEADRQSAEVHLPDLRGYLDGLTADSVRAATCQVESIPLPRTREFPSWTPRPARRYPSIEPENDRLALDD